MPSLQLVLATLLAVGTGQLVLPLKASKPVLAKRAAELGVQNCGSSFYVSLQVGSPVQAVDVIVDTGSSDLWFPGPNTIASAKSFDYSQSSSFHNNNSGFAIEYVDGTVASGIWGTDTVQFGSTSMTGVSLAVATSANTTMGIMGLGLPGLESTVLGTLNGEPYGTYSNFPMLLKEQGIIDYMSYSLSLLKTNLTKGSLVFGGIDTAAYDGDLEVVPLVRTSNSKTPQSISVMLHGLLYGQQSIVSCGIPVLLDSGASISHLPGPFVEAIAQAASAQYSSDLGVYVLPCSSEFDLALDLSGINITMSSNELIPLYASNGAAATSNGTAMCMVPFIPSKRDYILGTGALECMYLVFDYEKYQVAIAPQVSPKSGSSIKNISEVSTVQAPKYSSTLSTTNFMLHMSVSTQSGVPSQVDVTSLAPLSSGAVLATATSSKATSSNGAPMAGLDRFYMWFMLIIY